MSTGTIANEVVQSVRERQSFSLLNMVRNEYFLYLFSSVAFVLIWHWVAS